MTYGVEHRAERTKERLKTNLIIVGNANFLAKEKSTIMLHLFQHLIELACLLERGMRS